MTLMIVTWVSAIALNPVGTILSASALFPQMALVKERPDVGSLSTLTLAAQGILFIVVGITWNFRLGPLDEKGPEAFPPLFYWYNMVGFAVIDNIIFAIVQLVLLFTARRKSTTEATAQNTASAESTPEEDTTSDENSPLLTRE